MRSKKWILWVLIINPYTIVFAQTRIQNIVKPRLDIAAFNNWTSVGGGIISNDGNYVCYIINNYSQGHSKLIVQATNSNWKREFSDASIPAFTNDSRLLVFKIGQDSLCLLKPGKEPATYIRKVGAYKIISNDNDQWLVYTLITPARELVLCSLKYGKEQHFSSVGNYVFTTNGNSLLIENQKENTNEIVVQRLNLTTDKLQTVWSSGGRDEKPGSFAFDNAGNQIAFLVEKKTGNQQVYELWYDKTEADTAVMLANDQTPGIDDGLLIADQGPKFSKNGSHIFFGLQSTEQPKQKPGALQVDVWNYRDLELQSLQLEAVKNRTIYKAVINVLEKHVVRLEQSNEDELQMNLGDDFVLVRHDIGNYGQFESNWNLSAQISFFLVSVKDGSRKLLKDHIANVSGELGISPGGKWIIYYDFQQKNYFSYEVTTGITRNISKGSTISWLTEDTDYPEPSLAWVPWRKTWLANDKAVLIYDSYDIWQVDPSGEIPPINLTNGYGRLHHIKFQLMNENSKFQEVSEDKNGSLLLTAFNTLNKQMGFFSTKLNVSESPKLCSMGPYVYGSEAYVKDNNLDNYQPPVKARNNNTYLVTRMSSADAPNYFVTKDFKTFLPVSNVQPQKTWNWMTTKLVHWNMPDGSMGTGILYKPENFDLAKKYPLIFGYYDKRSDELNMYIYPDVSSGRINIPSFVSNGYLVFVPDMQYKIGQVGQGIYNSVVSAAGFISKMPWVDAKRMGIQGHSFGGYETNYLVTHTHLFAAACEASGFCDLVSFWASIARGDYPMYWAERTQGRFGATLFERPDLYIQNSPLFKVDAVTTPLLMMNNKKDPVVPFSQGEEFFNSLRRLGKRVWMLQYDDGGHQVFGKSSEDFTIRMNQFFDYYLKGASAPKWMVDGVPADMKGIDNGLELEPKGVSPGPGLNVN